MPADAPTILATSGGITEGRRSRFAFTPLTDFAVELSGVTGRPPRICLLATAMGDDRAVLHDLTEAARNRGFAASQFLQRLVGDGTLPAAYATDDGAGVLYRGSQFCEAVAERPGAAAYSVVPGDGTAVETRLEVRRLRG